MSSEQSSERAPRGAKKVRCPTCGAPVGEPCRGSAYSGRAHRTVQSHQRRVQIAKTGVDPWPEAGSRL